MSGQSPDAAPRASDPSPSEVVVAVLAAGHGTRMRSERPKHLHPVAGVPIVERVMLAGIDAGAGRTLVMVGSNLADLERHISLDRGYEVVVQGPPRGTHIGPAFAVKTSNIGQLAALPITRLFV